MPSPDLRRSMSAQAGAVSVRGEPDAAERLRAALLVPPMPAHLDDDERALVEAALSMHLFHSFAARTHPLTVRHLLRDVAPGQIVLDPFVGSGTVPIEAALRGARGAGLDVGELQVRLSRFKATAMPAPMQKALLLRAESVALASQERVSGRRRPQRNWDDPRHYEPHVYLELCGLREEIETVRTADPPIGEGLLLLFSAIVIKASRQRSESRAEEVSRSIGKGQATRWFAYKAQELGRLLAAFADRVPRDGDKGRSRAVPPILARGDARSDLVRISGSGLLPPGGADVVCTSPPYLGVYDYAAHHARRCAWLDIDLSALATTAATEIGARRHGASLPRAEALALHQRDTDQWLDGVCRALVPGGPAYVLVGDTSLPGPPGPSGTAAPFDLAPGDEPILSAAERAGLRFVAACSVVRPGPPAAAPRREHLLHFVRPASAG